MFNLIYYIKLKKYTTVIQVVTKRCNKYISFKKYVKDFTNKWISYRSI